MDEGLLAGRLNFLKLKLREAEREHNFRNGYRAGLDDAWRWIVDGQDILGGSIDPAPRRETVKKRDKK